MSATQHVFLQPLDVLYLRGNRSFGGPGDFAPAQMPPWPSLVAGALRSRILADRNIDPAELTSSTLSDPALNAVLGTWGHPGDFRLSALTIARQQPGKPLETFHPCPSDLFIPTDGEPVLLTLARTLLRTSYATEGLTQLPALPLSGHSKPDSRWLTAAAWQAYLAGKAPARDQTVPQSDLWATDARVGVGLDALTRAAATGKLFSTDAVAPCCAVGLLATVSGAGAFLPRNGFVRLGGDGRAAALAPASQPELDRPDLAALASAGRFRMILTSPALFSQGWKPTLPFPATLAAAAAPRATVISGWDLLHWRPKPAERFATAGSVYWFENAQTTPEALRHLEIDGLWPPSLNPDLRRRRAEGFNAVIFAPWHQRA